jgi:hypothetical protein
MKNYFIKAIGLALFGVTAVSCTTSYDAYGNPRQNVDPVAAAAVAGVAGYAIGQNQNKKQVYVAPGYYGRPHYGHRPYYGPRPVRRW